MKIHLSTYDLPADLSFSPLVAIDTEAMGLRPHRDRLCVVQVCFGSEDVYLVHFPTRNFDGSPRLKALLTDASIQKIFHYGRFDIALLMHSFNISISNVYCTKIASRLTRSYTGRHGLKDLCKELLGVEISKEEQSSDWGAPELTPQQQAYAAKDVLYLHALKEKMDARLVRENHQNLAQACFDFLPYRCQMDLMGGDNYDLFPYQNEL